MTRRDAPAQRAPWPRRHRADADGQHDGIPVSIDSTAGLDISE
ncbi:MAG TPA: hypothetical protein VGD83_26905 [Streptosporangiaceae bacterium]